MNIACNNQVTVNEVKEVIEKHTGKKLDLKQKPARLGDVDHTRADISRAEKLLGYKPLVDFESGIEKTITWFMSRKI